MFKGKGKCINCGDKVDSKQKSFGPFDQQMCKECEKILERHWGI